MADFNPKDEIFLTDLAVRHIALPGYSEIPEHIMFEALEATNMQVRDVYTALDDYVRHLLDPTIEQVAELIKELLFDRYQHALMAAMASHGLLL